MSVVQAQSIYVPNFGAGAKIIHVTPDAARARASLPRDDFEPDQPDQTDAQPGIIAIPAPPPPRQKAALPSRPDNAMRSRRRPYSNGGAPSRHVSLPPISLPSVSPPSVELPPPGTEEAPETSIDIGPKRTLLSAPPLSADGPSPIKPTPRWRVGERHDPPVEDVIPVAPLELEKFPSAPVESIPSQGIPANVPLPPVPMVPPTSEELPPE